MSDAHDRHVLTSLIEAVRATPGAPPASAAELEAQLNAAPGTQGGGASLLDAARDAVEGLFTAGPGPAAASGGEGAGPLEALLARMDAALRDGRLSGPARDAVLRAFDPVKEARDAALQRRGGEAA